MGEDLVTRAMFLVAKGVTKAEVTAAEIGRAVGWQQTTVPPSERAKLGETLWQIQIQDRRSGDGPDRVRHEIESEQRKRAIEAAGRQVESNGVAG